MKFLTFLPLGALAAAAALFLSGCSSEPDVNYPVTYHLPIGNSQVTSAYGPQNMNVNATQDVQFPAGRTLYYQVISPVNLTFYVFDKTGPGPGGSLLGQMQGTTFTSSATTQSGTLEFVISASDANTGGTVTFTISDRPLTPAAPIVGPNSPPPAPQTAPGTGVTVTPNGN